jgi:hypothetical protein
VEQPDNSVAKTWLILNKKGPNFNKVVSLLLSSLMLGKCPRNIVIFPLTQTEICSVVLKPKFHQKGKMAGAKFFFFIGRIFSSGLAEKFCRELATLISFTAAFRN